MLLLVPAAYVPLRVFATNLGKFPHPGRIALIVITFWALGVLWYFSLMLLGVKRMAALVSAFVFTFLLSAGGRLSIITNTYVAIAIVIGGAIAFVFVLDRIGGDALRLALYAMAGFLLVGPLIALFASVDLGEDPDAIAQPTSSLPTRLESKTDIFVVVLDGFPGRRAIEDVYGEQLVWDDVEGVARHDAWASYPVTVASTASLFEMGYPVADGTILDSDTRSKLERVMAGENRLVKYLEGLGYESVFLESGWSRSGCTDVIDVCVESTFLDEGTFEVLRQTVIGQWLVETQGSAFTVGARHAMEWSLSTLDQMAKDEQPHFVFVTVLLPHPPLMVDADCQVVYDSWRVGHSLYVGKALIEARQQAYLDQARCAADFEENLFRAIPEGATLIFLSDHGGDSLGQLSTVNQDWSHGEIVERLNTHLAIRSGVPCGLEEPVLIPELMRDVLWCMAGQDPDAAAPERRMFVASHVGEPNKFRLDALDGAAMASLGVLPRGD